MSAIVSAEELGRRIRKLRVERRLTLKQVEHTSGLSATHLSEIERGRTSPTIGALVRIARALDRDASYFIEPEERSEVAVAPREQDAVFSPAPGVRARALSAGIPGTGLHPYQVTVEAGRELRLPAIDTQGDAIYYVQHGSLETHVGSAKVSLDGGDSMQATLEHEHVVRASGGSTAEFVLVSTAPLPGSPGARAEVRS